MKSILVVIVNYGDEQLNYLQRMIDELNSFSKYKVDIVVHSNIPLSLSGVTEIKIFQLNNFEYLPLTCRTTIWEKKDEYDVYVFSENDHLITENHIDKHLEYEVILPSNRISGLIQYEINETGRYYPAYHKDFKWDSTSVEIYNNKIFAQFTNLHQASFILSKNQLARVGKQFDFTKLVNHTFLYRILQKFKKIVKLPTITNPYSVKCRVNTDVYQYGGMKKLICISEFEQNIVHHMPNLYINGENGRLKLREDERKMYSEIQKLLEINS